MHKMPVKLYVSDAAYMVRVVLLLLLMGLMLLDALQTVPPNDGFQSI